MLISYKSLHCIVAEWWKNYGVHTPHLQNIAIKVLSLTCSSSGCERNWSIFEHVSKCEIGSIQRALVSETKFFFNYKTGSFEKEKQT